MDISEDPPLLKSERINALVEQIRSSKKIDSDTKRMVIQVIRAEEEQREKR